MPRGVPGLIGRTHVRKDGSGVTRAYYDRRLPRIGRVVKALGCDLDSEHATQRASALNMLVDRGDLDVIARWRDEGVPDITEIVSAVRTGRYDELRRIATQSPTLGEAVDAFLEAAEATKNPRTAAQYSATLNQLTDHFGRNRRMGTITTGDAEEFLWAPKETVGGEVWAPSTQGDARTVCKALWKRVMAREREAAAQKGLTPTVAINPWERATVRRRVKTRKAWLLPEEWRTLIRHEQIRGTPAAALLGLACLAGLRRAEICHLRTGFDVDREADIIRVQPREGEWAWAPKGYTHGITHSVRDVPIVPALAEILDEHVRRGYAGKRYLLHASWKDRPLGESTAEDWTRAALKAAGLDYGRDAADTLTLHSLRHTCATWQVRKGVPIPTVAAWLGNTAETTLSTYAHHVPDDMEIAIEAIQEGAE